MYKLINRFIKLSVIFKIMLLTITNLNAQLSMQFNAVNEYVFSRKEALNFTAINSNPKPFEAIFTGTIKKGNGELVCEFKTSPVWLQTGANVFTPFTLSMADLNYHDQDILEIETKSGQYPSGNYTICIIGNCATADCNGLGASAAAMETPICISIQTENPTPLILVNPENESEIEETRPNFLWIPPSPVAGSANLNYTLILVEMLEGQNKADALSQNRPLIEMEGITNPALMYPSDLPELEKGKWYAWQVQAYVGKTPIAKSEQWKFKVKKKEEKKETIQQAVFLKVLNNPYLFDIKDDSLYIGLVNIPYKILTQTYVTVLIKDHTGQIIHELDVEIKNDIQNAGYQLVKIPVISLFPKKTVGYYTLEFKDLNETEKYLKVRIQE